MEVGSTIKQSLNAVADLRAERAGDPALAAAVTGVKRLQAARFAGDYHDMLRSAPYDAAAGFFLSELYGPRDFSDRDAQFARIAGAIQRLFPAPVAATAGHLAQLHALTEELDNRMGRVWVEQDLAESGKSYVLAWRAVGRRDARARQLAAVQELGRDMARLTRTPGLRTTLRLMRGPASVAGLGMLQAVLESGFDAFAGISKRAGAVEVFLDTIGTREAAAIGTLFDADLVTCETWLARTLGQAP